MRPTLCKHEWALADGGPPEHGRMRARAICHLCGLAVSASTPCSWDSKEVEMEARRVVTEAVFKAMEVV